MKSKRRKLSQQRKYLSQKILTLSQFLLNLLMRLAEGPKVLMILTHQRWANSHIKNLSLSRPFLSTLSKKDMVGTLKFQPYVLFSK